MKRDWDIARQVLVDIEEDTDPMQHMSSEPIWENQTEQQYKEEMRQYHAEENRIFGHVELLLESGCIAGIEVIRFGVDSWGYSLHGPRLTMAGHDLLETMRSQGLWEKIKSTAKSRSIELTVDSIKAIAATLIAKTLA